MIISAMLGNGKGNKCKTEGSNPVALCTLAVFSTIAKGCYWGPKTKAMSTKNELEGDVVLMSN